MSFAGVEYVVHLLYHDNVGFVICSSMFLLLAKSMSMSLENHDSFAKAKSISVLVDFYHILPMKSPFISG